MKLLTVGDLHYNVRQFDWLLASAEAYDAVIIVGDLLNIAGHVDLDTQILVANKYLQKLQAKTTLLVCSGNHDGDRKGASGEYFADWLDTTALESIHGDGAGLSIGDWRFSSCPWWDGPEGRAKVDSFLRTEKAKAHKHWFIIHHAPPSETRTAWTGKRDFGDSHLREFIIEHEPEIVLSGHIHNAPFRQEDGWYDTIGATRIFNAGYQMGDLPPCLVFDLENKTVSWSSLAGQESISL
jgi:Icc-related predicted phosphoesterase